MDHISYNKTKIGTKIAQGGDRRVHLYDTDRVIKISTLSFFVGDKLHKKLTNDYLIAREYFKDYVLETFDASEDGIHIEIQAFIPGELLKKNHIQNPHIKKQLQEISNILDTMFLNGSPYLDLVGNAGVLKPCLSNIIVDKDNNLKIIDTTLLEGRTVRPFGVLLEILLPLVIARQKYLLREFLK